ncbi:hypothetical protein [Microbacterium sp. No. 7]|uniref:hypothetical protein n=1 Tax=Microbacterium sp. No. 7 TaxID=1714373 RepID=UPI0006CFF030|nr:hypothetical protein [Microbacterium sp. No. 7]ALJ19556.1 hypothetical protein AOA12_06385 [Microbacterium sp. No. 7]
MIKEAIYYQAQCDVCGTVDDGGTYSAYLEPDHARMAAVDSAEWTEIEVRVSDDAEGGEIYTYAPDGQAPFKKRSILICQGHNGAGIGWCSTCEDDLDEATWVITADGRTILQTCPNRHLNTVTLKESS